MGEKKESSGQDIHHLFREKKGLKLKVQRELTSDELGWSAGAVITTREGFKIRGQNSTELIRSLASLNGVPIKELETRMRSEDGTFIGKDESLTQILADDNDRVQELGLTHQQLAEFLGYFTVVDDRTKKLTGKTPHAYNEYKGRIYAFHQEKFRGIQGSPFDDGTTTNSDYRVVCLDDGSAINYSGLLPAMIDSYGFYEGKDVRYRLDPKKVAEVGGFIPRAEDDPIAQLVKDKNARVVLTTSDQITRLNNLLSIGIGIFEGSKYRIVPEDIKALLKYVEIFKRPSYKYENNAAIPEELRKLRAQIEPRVDTQEMKPTPYQIKSIDDLELITEVLPIDFPQLKATALNSIENIQFVSGVDEHSSRSLAEREFLQRILRGIKDKAVDNENPHKTYFEGLLRRLNRDPLTVLHIYYGLSSLDRGGRDIKNSGFPDNVASILPTLREDIIAVCKLMHFPIKDNITLQELLVKSWSLRKHQELLMPALQFVMDEGGVEEAHVEDIAILLNIITSSTEDPNRTNTPEDALVMKKLGIDPAIIQQRARLRQSPEEIIAGLFRGRAEKAKLDNLMKDIPEIADDQAKNAILAIVKNHRNGFGGLVLTNLYKDLKLKFKKQNQKEKRETNRNFRKKMS